MSNILITGGAGFIGSQLAYKLYKLGETITIIDNFSYGKEDNLIFDDCDFRNELIHMDIRDKQEIEGLFAKKNFDIVYHIAAITPLPDCQTEPQAACDVNVTGTVNILEASRKTGVKNIIFASTSAVYENNEKFPLKESDDVSPSLIYPVTKYTAEQYCRAYCKCYNMDITCIRFTNVYGPHIDCLRKQPPVAAYIIRELYYDRAPVLHDTGEQKRDFIYVDDLLNLAVLAQTGTGFDIVNASSFQAYSINDMFTIIAQFMKKESIVPQYREPSHFWKHYSSLYEGFYTISEDVLKHEVTKYTLLDNSKAKQKYGFEPLIGFEEGLKHTVDYTCGILKKLQMRG